MGGGYCRAQYLKRYLFLLCLIRGWILPVDELRDNPDECSLVVFTLITNRFCLITVHDDFRCRFSIYGDSGHFSAAAVQPDDNDTNTIRAAFEDAFDHGPFTHFQFKLFIVLLFLILFSHLIPDQKITM